MAVVVQDLIELAGRCEKAMEPYRELDARIAAAVRYHPYGPSHWMGDSDIAIRATGHCVQGFRDTGESCGSWGAPEYTASIDAAMTLVPPHPIYSDWSLERDDDTYRASIHAPHDERDWMQGATPALALCAAALRARASIKGEG